MEVIEMLPITKFKACLSILLDRVNRSGQTILLTKNGEPLAIMKPPPLKEVKKS